MFKIIKKYKELLDDYNNLVDKYNELKRRKDIPCGNSSEMIGKLNNNHSLTDKELDIYKAIYNNAYREGFTDCLIRRSKK